MTLRRLIMIAVCLPATVFVSSGWGQGPPPKRVAPASDTISAFQPYDNGWGDYSTPIDYSQEIKKSVELLKSETERSGIKQITDELDTKSNRDILALTLAPDVCQEIACRGVWCAAMSWRIGTCAPLMLRSRPHCVMQRPQSGVRSSPLRPQVFLSSHW
jgi:hypothetical protein